jgi:hypothetical protein
MGGATGWLVRAAALWLAIESALLITGVARSGEQQPPFISTFARALAIALPLQAGLLWAPSARGWWRLCAAVLMIPGALLVGSLAGEQISRIVRGYPLNVAAAITFIGGAAVYAWQFWSLARRPRSSGGAHAPA